MDKTIYSQHMRKCSFIMLKFCFVNNVQSKCIYLYHMKNLSFVLTRIMKPMSSSELNNGQNLGRCNELSVPKLMFIRLADCKQSPPQNLFKQR